MEDMEAAQTLDRHFAMIGSLGFAGALFDIFGEPFR